ncbi:AraC family transcriptional regulator [Cohnella sp. JJ-181]|uniref:AraC family transcriptional regulator n=1 Tax=Cohnella rhizoplanae TaxID=2974897 RepID=UPI0022FF60F1|nr:AraC family transcriptional regulator [Cohnella sp. JJ-181]CAI6025008.1 HTH-type transcriptional activator Btr [Cohnella sp. JJ-181]
MFCAMCRLNGWNDLQPEAAGLLCYRLLNVELIREMPQALPTERRFIETKSPALLLSNAQGGRLVIDGRSHALRPGALFVCRAGRLIELTNYAGSPVELLLLEFDAFFPPVPGRGQREEAVKPGATAIDRLPFPPYAQLPSASAAGQLFGAISAGWRTGALSDRLRCEAALLELLSLSLSCREQQVALALEAALAELERRYAGDVTIDDLAAIAGLSRFHFMRQFKERYGKGVMEYRAELRLRDAKRLMSGPDGPTLSEIVYRVGYTSESYFSSVFKKQTGIAPAVYQRNQRRRIAAYSWANFGQLLALRSIPYAAPTDQYWTDYYRKRYAYEVQAQLSHQYEFNRKALLAARPDMIVGIASFIPPDEQDKLRDIAPTLLLDWEADWRSHLRQVGAFLGDAGEAERWIGRYDRDAADLRERLAQVVGRDAALLVIVGRQGISVCGRRAGTVLYDDLGFGVPAGLETGDIAWTRTVTPEELSGFGADRILVHRGSDSAADAEWERLARSESWRSLPAVREGKVHFGSGCDYFEAPVNEYAAEPMGRALAAIPRWFGCG